jgi:ubiquinone/menaquinone biosynthesis C-methylase UbiE
MEKTIVYNKIGSEYNTTRKADPYIAEKIYNFLAPEEGKTYLDIGCGTGNYTVKLEEMGVDFIGVDPSEVMLERASIKKAPSPGYTAARKISPYRTILLMAR